MVILVRVSSKYWTNKKQNEVIKVWEHLPDAAQREHSLLEMCCFHELRKRHPHPLGTPGKTTFTWLSQPLHNNKRFTKQHPPSFKRFSAVSRDILPWNQFTLSSLFILNKKELVWKVNWKLVQQVSQMTKSFHPTFIPHHKFRRPLKSSTLHHII